MQAIAINQGLSIGQSASHAGTSAVAQDGNFMQLMMQLMGQNQSDIGTLMSEATTDSASIEELLGLSGEQEDGEDTNYLMQLMAGMLGHGTPQVAMYNSGETEGTATTTQNQALEQLLGNAAAFPGLPTDAEGRVTLQSGQAFTLPGALTGKTEMSMEILTENYSATGQPTMGKAEEQQNLMQNAFAQMAKPQQAATGRANSKTEVPIDIDALQQAVDSGRFLNQSVTAPSQLTPTADPQTLDILAQVKTGILANMDKGSNEFVLKLTPEGLGEITVKMTEAGGKISLSIITGNQQTQNALASEISSLRDALRPLGAEVQQVITQQEANLAQGFGEHRHGQSGQEQRGHYQWEPEREQEPQQAEYVAALSSALNTYI
ncbi:MAG: flagellar hook-length control protein FliK [Angelakisella sp.]